MVGFIRKYMFSKGLVPVLYKEFYNLGIRKQMVFISGQ